MRSAGAATGKAVEHRGESRVRALRVLRLHGAHGPLDAVLLDVSQNGALVAILDEKWEAVPESEDFGLTGLRVASNFGEGFRMEFVDTETSIDAEVVRMQQGRVAGIAATILGCQFLRSPTQAERAAVGLQALVDPDEGTIAQDPGGAADPVAPAPVVIRPVSEPPPQARKPADATHIRLTEGDAPLGIIDLLGIAVDRDASDLHIKAGSPIRMRVESRLARLGNHTLTAEEAEALVRDLLTEEQFQRFLECSDLDLAFSLPGRARFRVNVLRSRGDCGLAIRRIPEVVPSAEELGLAPVCLAMAEKPRGLVLVTGPTGSGKSTTLAAMIQHINRTRQCHIVTMEDPIEYIHREVKAHITQREIGRDTQDFASALRRALRQDPDVILVGEMRDLETIALAVTAAETGHLVFATLHTTSAVLTVDRIVDVFPPAQQRQIRMQLADALQAIFSQTLLPRRGRGVVCAQEILVANGGVRALIREGKAPQIGNMMQTGARDGMQTLEDALNDLIAREEITFEAAIGKANHPQYIKPEGAALRR